MNYPKFTLKSQITPTSLKLMLKRTQMRSKRDHVESQTKI